jgi:hypothetical protein
LVCGIFCDEVHIFTYFETQIPEKTALWYLFFFDERFNLDVCHTSRFPLCGCVNLV